MRFCLRVSQITKQCRHTSETKAGGESLRAARSTSLFFAACRPPPPTLFCPFSFPTHSQDRFYELANPNRENLCLYGNPDSTWEVDLPAEEVS